MCDMKGCSSANTLGRLNVTAGSDLVEGAKYLSKMSILRATMLPAYLEKAPSIETVVT